MMLKTIVVTIFPIFAVDAKLKKSDVGIIFSLEGFAAIFGAAFTVKLMQRFDKKTLIIATQVYIEILTKSNIIYLSIKFFHDYKKAFPVD